MAVETVRQLIASGRVARSTLLWSEGLAGWMPAERTEFAGLFERGGPPPLPFGGQLSTVPPYGVPGPAGDGVQSAVNLIYILYIVGFFVPITALVGVIMAYSNRSGVTQPYRSHYDWQIRMFWVGLAAAACTVAAYILAVGAAFFSPAITVVVAVITYPVVTIGWFAWTIFAIVKGMSALPRREAMPATGFL